MSSARISLALARAVLGGPCTDEAAAARIRRCLAIDAPWCDELGRRCVAWLAARPADTAAVTLAAWIGRDPVFQLAEQGRPALAVRGHFLFETTHRPVPPPALGEIRLPAWTNVGRLAEALGVPVPGLWRLTRPTHRQRQAGLGEQHYRFRLCPKRTGGWRLLEVPQPWLRALQRRVLDELLARIPPHEAACAYLADRTVVDHARTHVGQRVLLKFDLQDFFATVRASRVHATFATLGYADEVARALTALCTTATPEPVLERLREDGGLSWTQAQRLRDAHLPQGAPSSPALANLCAFAFDVRVAAFARELGARYTRYADDLVLSGGDALRANRLRIEVRIGAIALEEGFALNHRKSRCVAQSRPQRVCGIVVNARTNLPRAEFDRLKAILHGCVRHGPASQNREGHADWKEHLRGRIAWAAQLNAPKAARLQRLFAQVDWGGEAP
jgi:hypothetical protein